MRATWLCLGFLAACGPAPDTDTDTDERADTDTDTDTDSDTSWMLCDDGPDDAERRPLTAGSGVNPPVELLPDSQRTVLGIQLQAQGGPDPEQHLMWWYNQSAWFFPSASVEGCVGVRMSELHTAPGGSAPPFTLDGEAVDLQPYGEGTWSTRTPLPTGTMLQHDGRCLRMPEPPLQPTFATVDGTLDIRWTPAAQPDDGDRIEIIVQDREAASEYFAVVCHVVDDGQATLLWPEAGDPKPNSISRIRGFQMTHGGQPAQAQVRSWTWDIPERE